MAVKSSYFRAPMPASGTQSVNTCFAYPWSAKSSGKSPSRWTSISGKSYSSVSEDCGICIVGLCLCRLGGEYKCEMNLESGFCGVCWRRLNDNGLDLVNSVIGIADTVYSDKSSPSSVIPSSSSGLNKGRERGDEEEEASIREEEPRLVPWPFIVNLERGNLRPIHSRWQNACQTSVEQLHPYYLLKFKARWKANYPFLNW